jgi:hypothetical protein
MILIDIYNLWTTIWHDVFLIPTCYQLGIILYLLFTMYYIFYIIIYIFTSVYLFLSFIRNGVIIIVNIDISIL